MIIIIMVAAASG